MGKLPKLVRSFKHAFDGLAYAVSKEQNLQIELAVALMVISTMILLHVERWEAVALVFAIFGVIVLEMINTLVERLVNIFRPRIHPYVRVIKDIMAATVFMASLAAVLIGILIFWPYIFG